MCTWVEQECRPHPYRNPVDVVNPTFVPKLLVSVDQKAYTLWFAHN